MPTDSELAGQALREHLVVEPDTATHAIERAKLVNAVTARHAARSSRVPVLAFAALSTVVLVAALVLWVRPRAEQAKLAFSVGPDARAGQLGVYYAATGSDELPLRFADGSAVAVQPQGGVRVQENEASRVALLVETGRARFDVEHRPQARWEIAAGPYSVSVTGTAFDLGWDPKTRGLELVMRSGSVTVTGPGIETGVVVRDTQRFVTRVVADVDRSKTALAAPSKTEPEPAKAAVLAPPPVTAPSAPARALPSWNALLAKGDYAGIVHAAEERGIDQSIASASADELRALADAARFTGRSALAERALLAIRSRFPGTPAATAAAFVLGRMLDTGGNARAAVTWYDRYLAEGGPLAPEALGRRMSALHRSGDAAASRDAAREYLRRFPGGPYARQARELTR